LYYTISHSFFHSINSSHIDDNCIVISYCDNKLIYVEEDVFYEPYGIVGRERESGRKEKMEKNITAD